MTPEQIQLVRQTFDLARPKANVVALVFYQRLFALDPAVRPLFKTDIEEQSRKLMEMLAAMIDLLEKPLVFTPFVEELGRRHTGYGVKDEHYATVGTALLDAFARALGDAFTPAARQAWTALYSLVATTMIDAAAANRNCGGTT